MRSAKSAKHRGIALLLVLVALVIAATLATTFVSSQSTTSRIAGNMADSVNARYIAETGLRLATQYVETDTDWRTNKSNGTWVTNQSFAGGTFSIVGQDGVDADEDGAISVPTEGDGDLTDDVEDLLTLTATGTYGNCTHFTRAVLTPIFGSTCVAFEEFTEYASDVNASSITISTPSGTQEGDLLIAVVVADGQVTFSPPGGEGWAEIANEYNNASLGVWWKLADASESSSHTFTWGGSEDRYGWIMRFTGQKTTNPIDVSDTNSGSSSTPTAPTVTTSVDDALVLRIGAFDNDDVSIDDTGLSGYTTITMDESGNGSYGTCSGGAGYLHQDDAGATGTADFSLTASASYVTCTLAIKPQPGAGQNCGGGGGGGVTPIAHWKFDETSGTTASDSSGNGYTGTQTSCDWVAGQIDNAIELDGSGDYVTVSGLLGQPTNLTISAWFDLDAGANQGELISMGDHVGLRIDQDSSSTQGFFYIGGSWVGLTTGINYAGTGWHHIAFVIDDTNDSHKIYVDGTQRASSTAGNSIVWSGLGSNTIIGRHGDGQTTFDFEGTIDDVRVYDSALSSSDITDLANGDEPGGGGGAGTVDIRVTSSSDDAEQSGTSVTTNSADLDIRNTEYSGMRFQNVTIPNAATITSAYVEFTAAATNNNGQSANIWGEDTDDASTFSASSNDISGRSPTSANVSWSSIPAWNAASTYQTADISAIIQEIVDRGGWSSGNDMVIIVRSASGDERSATTYDGSAGSAPLLHVEYDASDDEEVVGYTVNWVGYP